MLWGNPHGITKHERHSRNVRFDEKQIYPSFSEEPAVTGDTFLAMMENIALRHVPVRTRIQSDGTLPHFSGRVRTFLANKVSDR
jgi:hypothetical protein